MLWNERGATHGEFSDFGVIDAHDLILLTSTEAETRNQIHNEEDQTGPAKRVNEARHGVCELVGKLDVMLVEPATIDLGEAIKMRYVITNAKVSTGGRWAEPLR